MERRLADLTGREAEEVEAMLRTASQYSRAVRQVPIKYQLVIFGLPSSKLGKMRGMRGLDIACGNGELVRYMNGVGLQFEGLDAIAPEGPEFFRFFLNDVFPNPGSIPQPDNTYDLITNFQNTCLGSGFSDVALAHGALFHMPPENVRRIQENARREATATVREMARVLKPGATALIYPISDGLPEIMGAELERMGVGAEHQVVKDRGTIRSYFEWEMNGQKFSDQSFDGLYETVAKFRTVLTKR